MLDRFTDRARKVMSLAKEEAKALKTSKVGTEHLLLALAKEQEGIAAEALRDLEITYDDILKQLGDIRAAAPAEAEPEDAKLAFTPLVVSVMEKSFRLARENNQTYVSTEHLLLAIVSEGDGVAMDILRRLGVSAASVRTAVEKLTSNDQGKQRPLAGAGSGRPGAGLPFFGGGTQGQQGAKSESTLKQFGTNLTEDTVTKQIMSMRTSNGYTKDKDWAQYLVDNDLTPKKYRKQLIDSYTQQILLQQAQKENGVTVSDEEVEKAWKDACKSAGGAKAFKKTLKTYGYTEDTYKDSLKESLAQQKLKDAVAPTSKPKDSEIVDYINENLSSYNDARRSSNILIKVDSDASDEDKAAAKAKAQECLDKINSGELSFEDAVEQYSEDTGSKEKKGDVGWDKLTTFVDSYQTALEGLNKGDVSEVVESTYGYHIIKCTDYFHVDNQVDDINQVPKDIKKYVSNVVKTQAASTAYSEWLEQYKKDADITVNPMPKDVPYNVSLKGVTKSSTDDSSTTE